MVFRVEFLKFVVFIFVLVTENVLSYCYSKSLINRSSKKYSTVKDIVEGRKLISILPDATLGDALKIMSENGIRRLPVVSGNDGKQINFLIIRFSTYWNNYR